MNRNQWILRAPVICLALILALSLGACSSTKSPGTQVDDAAKRVREGASISQALGRSGLFPPLVVHLIASGESSGELPAMLERAAANQERELETLISAMLGILEPALILLMGGVVLLIVLAILLPIFDLNTMVH